MQARQAKKIKYFCYGVRYDPLTRENDRPPLANAPQGKTSARIKTKIKPFIANAPFLLMLKPLLPDYKIKPV
jgi:hypothetical protein